MPPKLQRSSAPDHCNTTRCLSKLHGALLIILSTSSFFSKVNNKTWLVILQTSKPFTDLQRGLKVIVTTSTFKVLLVRNFAAMVKFLVQSSSSKPNSSPSLAFKDIFCQCFVSVHISIALASRVSQNPSKRKLTANSLQAINCLSYTESSYQQQQLLQPKGSQLVPQRRLLTP